MNKQQIVQNELVEEFKQGFSGSIEFLSGVNVASYTLLETIKRNPEKYGLQAVNPIDPLDVQEVDPGATYSLPLYFVDSNGLQNGGRIDVKFCKGNSEDPSVFYQKGFITESVLEACRQYLTAVNKGELANRETSSAITKIDEALQWLGKRSADRKRRKVQGTYQK